MTYTTTVFSIPKPVSEDHINQFIRIRLAALKTNPEAFGSTYARESAFPHRQWCERVNNRARTTLVATTALSAIAENSLERDAGFQYDDHESKWIGTLSVLAPEMLHSESFPPKIVEAEERGDIEIYMLVGMWVRPDLRKKGVGRQLVEHASQVVRDLSVINSSQNREGKQKVLLLEVDDTNFEAQRLYESQSFIELEGTQEGRKWMALNIK